LALTVSQSPPPDPSSARLSRRALLRRGLAGAAGGVALGRAPVASAHATGAGGEPAAGIPRIIELHVGDLGPSGAPARVVAPAPLELVGLGWDSPSRPRLELRASRSGGGWGDWAPAGVAHGGTADPEAGGAAHVGDPVWTGAARAIEVRAAEPVLGLRLFGITGATAAGADAARRAGAAVASPTGGPIAAGPGQPSIIPRSAWGGNHVPPRRRPGYGVVLAVVVHHTEGSNAYGPHESAGQVLSVAQFHRDVKGWDDIGYNLLVDRYGQIFEGRAGGLEAAVIGAQAGGFNARTSGIANLGSFGAGGQDAAGLRALVEVLAWKLALHGVAEPGQVSVRSDGGPYTAIGAGHHVTVPPVAGHRDVDQTDCPGDALYAQLPALRPQIGARQGTLARLTLVPATKVARRGQPLALTGTLTGQPARGAAASPAPGGVPIAGAPIEVRELGVHGGRVLARTTTGPTGVWQAPVVLHRETVLVAVHRQRPGASSGGIVLPVR